MRNALNAVLVSGLALLAAPAFAEVPAGFDSAMTAIGADATAMAALVAPIVVLIVAAVVGLRLIKKFGSKV